jgi:hypothetical protein
VANSVHQNPQGSIWPLGNIVVVTPGTPVRITNLVDPTNANAPETAVGVGAGIGDEYTRRAQQIFFQGMKSGAARLVNNAGNIYVIRKPLAGAGGTTDIGTIILAVPPGQTFFLGSAALNRNVFNLYDFFIDADNAGDACQVSALIQ